MNKTISGFTIIELLIVVVVIAILAALSIVAYTGIQNRANNSAVQNDLAAASKALELYKIDNGEYPDNTTKLSTMIATAPLKASRQAYKTGTTYNYAYCSTPTTYGLAAQSKSEVAYYITNSSAAPQVFTAWGGTIAPICTGLGISSTFSQWGHRGDTQSWQAWVW